MDKKVLTAGQNGVRIDAYIARSLGELSRSKVQKLIEDGFVTLNGKTARANKTVKVGDIIEILLPPPPDVTLRAENIPLDIVYEDDDFAVINKQRGLTVHPAAGSRDGTLVNALLYHFKSLSSCGDGARPGIVHRLDKNTTGLIAVAKNDYAHDSLSRQIAAKKCRRIYRALCEGVIKEDSGTIDAPVGRSLADRKKMAVTAAGKPARTHFTVIKRYKHNTYAEFELETGRTHQIRVHLKHIGHSVVGDDVYGHKKQRFNLEGQLLHAYKLILTHPVTKKVMEFTAPLPDDFKEILEILDKSESL